MEKQYYDPATYEARKSIGYLIRRSRNLITQGLQALLDERFADKEVNFAQWVVLMCLRDNLANTPAELCQYICYDSGALTRLIDQMEKRGLLKRERSSRDRRVVELTLTDQGNRTVDMLMGTVVGFYNDMLAGFSMAETDTLIALLTRLGDNLSEKRRKG